MIRWPGLFMSIILLATLAAIAQYVDDYAIVISGEDSGGIPECIDCYANIVTQSDTQTIGNVKIGISDTGAERVGVGNEGLSASMFASESFARIDQTITTAKSAYTVEDLNLRNLPANGIMITNTDAPLVLRGITIESRGVKDQSYIPVAIGTQNAKNVIIENCTALGGELFRIANSQNILVKDNIARNFFLEGVKDSTVENCTSDCIMIKGMLSPFYSNKFFSSTHDIINDSLISLPENAVLSSERCTIKNCNQVKEIDLFNAEDCIVENCSVDDVGLWMMNVKNTTFRNTTVVNSTLSMDWSKNINFEDMTLINSDISLAGSVPEDYAIEFKNSTMNGMPIYCYKDQSGLKLENLNAGQIWLVNCPRSEITGVNAQGIYVVNSDGVVIENSKIDGDGVNLAFSKDCVISNNRLISNKSKNGIVQYAVCSNNTASFNIIP